MPDRTASPLVSVAIPAFCATDTLPQAVASILESGLPPDLVEIIIASDDGVDYSDRLPNAPNMHFCPIGPVRSGVGAARNRAVAAATGQFITYLDADDSWAPKLLASLLPLAQDKGAAFAPTAIMENNEEILRFPANAQPLDFTTLGASGASFRPLVKAESCGLFRNSVAQDIFHAAEVIALHGGACPVGAVPYRLNLGSTSVSAGKDYAMLIDQTYRAYRDDILQGYSRVSASHVAEAAAVFDARIALNKSFQQEGQGARFYHFLRERQPYTQ